MAYPISQYLPSPRSASESAGSNANARSRKPAVKLQADFHRVKKPEVDREFWLLRQRAKKAALRLAFKRYRCHHCRHGAQLRPAAPHLPRSAKAPRRPTQIDLPESLDLDNNYFETVSAMSKVRLASERKVRLNYLNFDRIQHISPSAALMLASEIDRWNEGMRGRLRARDENWNAAVKQLLCEMGLFELLSLDRPAAVRDSISATFLPFMRGDVDRRTNGGALAKELRLRIEKAAGVEVRKHLLYDGLTEAVTNVCQHAYRKPYRKKCSYRPWWMSAAFARDTGTVTVSFYDHGLTIPFTLPASGKIERWRHRLLGWNDGQRIRAAMTLGRSSTGKLGRGKGLQNFLELISGYPGSRLRIYSRRGLLTVTNRPNKSLSFNATVLDFPVRGTLIEWLFVPSTVQSV